jgi:protein-L-isoaspartate(D-aspartate) O-methyltransferase
MDYATARHVMVESQIRTNRITDARIAEAMEAIPREAFVPKGLSGVAYVDEALPIAPGRVMMEPLLIAQLAQAARLAPEDVVLQIGCGAGYLAAVLARLASTVVAVEPDSSLAEIADGRFAGLGIDTVAVVGGELTAGYPDQAPYDVIVFNGAVAEVPKTILDQLADGGRCVAVVEGDAAGIGAGKGTVYTRIGDAVSAVTLFDASTPLLPGFEKESGFVF